jgi:hypothetical protein
MAVRIFPMRVLYCNKYNYRFSGTEVYLFELMELMRSNGNEVALFAMALMPHCHQPLPYFLVIRLYAAVTSRSLPGRL